MESQLTKEREARIDRAISKKRVTLRQGQFVKRYLTHGIGGRAIKETYNAKTRNTQDAMSSEYLRKPKILQILQECGVTLEENLRDLAFNAKSETVKLGATGLALSYIYGKPTEHHDFTSDGKAVQIQSVNLLMACLTQGEAKTDDPTGGNPETAPHSVEI